MICVNWCGALVLALVCLLSLCTVDAFSCKVNGNCKVRGKLVETSLRARSNVGDSISYKQLINFTAERATLSAIAVSSALVVLANGAGAAETNFVKTESGLQYRDLKEGEGASPVPGDTVRVHYTGWLDDFESEKKFDSSYDRRTPLTFKAGVRQVIAGWDEALLTNMKVGTRRQVIIPPELGYGARGAGGVIPPNATLYFTMELVGIGAKANR